MAHILNNGIKYELLDFESEQEFEEAVIANSRHLFGEDAVYVDLKRKMGSANNYYKGIPDGYVIDFADLRQSFTTVLRWREQATQSKSDDRARPGSNAATRYG